MLEESGEEAPGQTALRTRLGPEEQHPSLCHVGSLATHQPFSTVQSPLASPGPPPRQPGSAVSLFLSISLRQLATRAAQNSASLWVWEKNWQLGSLKSF